MLCGYHTRYDGFDAKKTKRAGTSPIPSELFDSKSGELHRFGLHGRTSIVFDFVQSLRCCHFAALSEFWTRTFPKPSALLSRKFSSASTKASSSRSSKFRQLQLKSRKTTTLTSLCPSSKPVRMVDRLGSAARTRDSCASTTTMLTVDLASFYAR